MNSSSRDWLGKIDLMPLLKNRELADSLVARRTPLELLVSGNFPLGIPDLVSATENEKEFSLEVKINCRDSSQVKQIRIQVTQLSNQPTLNQGPGSQNVYPGRLNFVLEIDPKKFGLHLPPFGFVHPIGIEIQNGLVNKN